MVVPADVRAQHQAQERAPQDGEGEHVSIYITIQSPNLWRPGIDSKESIWLAYIAGWDGPITQFVVPALQATLAGGIDSLESIPGLPKRL
jgi:hypothetical protein